MGKLIDLTGKQFGRWTVLARAENNKWGRAMWLCRCNCGNEKIVPSTDLRSEDSKSCGCLKRELTSKRSLMDLTGKRFGRLVVTERAKNKWGTRWHCCCDCGAKCVVANGSLRSGHTQSCGCLQREIASKHNTIDIIGQVFGRLTVLRRAENIKNGGVYWHCRCKCGKECIARGISLRNGTTKSCGCLHREAITLPKGQAAFNSLFGRKKREARDRGYEWSLTKEQAHKLMQQRCFYCDAKPQQVSEAKTFNGAYVHNGLDRVDNNRGYHIENVVPCCKACNYAKRTMSLSEFRAWAIRLYEHFASVP